MLCGAVVSPSIEAIIVVDDDRGLAAAYHHLQKLRSEHISAEMISSGSPRKRFDKAVRLRPKAILRVGADGYCGISADGDVSPRLRAYLRSIT
jgi:histidyl-tRNA synthetase